MTVFGELGSWICLGIFGGDAASESGYKLAILGVIVVVGVGVDGEKDMG